MKKEINPQEKLLSASNDMMKRLEAATRRRSAKFTEFSNRLITSGFFEAMRWQGEFMAHHEACHRVARLVLAIEDAHGLVHALQEVRERALEFLSFGKGFAGLPSHEEGPIDIYTSQARSAVQSLLKHDFLRELDIAQLKALEDEAYAFQVAQAAKGEA